MTLTAGKLMQRCAANEGPWHIASSGSLYMSWPRAETRCGNFPERGLMRMTGVSRPAGQRNSARSSYWD